MPTADEAFAAVAAYVGHVDGQSKEAVDDFYLRQYQNYPEEAQQLISAFLVASVAMPDEAELAELTSRIEDIVAATRRRPSSLAW